MTMTTQSNADVRITINPMPGASRIEVHLTWTTPKPVSLDNVIGFLRELDTLGLTYITEAIPPAERAQATQIQPTDHQVTSEASHTS